MALQARMRRREVAKGRGGSLPPERIRTGREQLALKLKLETTQHDGMMLGTEGSHWSQEAKRTPILGHGKPRG